MSKEFKIGLITIIAGGLLYYGFNFLRGSDLFSPSNRYYVAYPNVTGLNVSNPVYFNGLPVGRVSGFQLEQTNRRIIVSVDINDGVYVGKLDTAQLANDGLFGGKAIILMPGASSDLLEPGDTILSEVGHEMFDEFEPLADNLNSTISKLNNVLDQISRTDIEGLVDTLKYSVGTVTEKVVDLDVESITGNLDEVIISFKERSDQLDTLLAGSTTFIDSLNTLPLKETIANLNETMDELTKLIVAVQSDEGTVGKLMNNDSLYNNLNKLLVDMDELIIHFNNYPKDFMRPLGRKHSKLKGVTKEEGE